MTNTIVDAPLGYTVRRAFNSEARTGRKPGTDSLPCIFLEKFQGSGLSIAGKIRLREELFPDPNGAAEKTQARFRLDHHGVFDAGDNVRGRTNAAGAGCAGAAIRSAPISRTGK